MDEGQGEFLEPHVERLIREAMEAGEFDDLPGAGKPIPGVGKHDDDLWWVREWMKRNNVGPDELLRRKRDG